MCNLHGSRVNQDIPERTGSGYVAHHGKDFLFANDPWFRGLALMYGPDGGVFVSDWCDTGECHNYEHITETTGRIYKVTYGKAAPVDVDLAKSSDAELVKLQSHKNEWFARHARRLLQERANDGKLDRKTVQPALVKMLAEAKETPLRLRALWTLYVIGGLDEKALDRAAGRRRRDGARLGGAAAGRGQEAAGRRDGEVRGDGAEGPVGVGAAGAGVGAAADAVGRGVAGRGGAGRP